MPFPRPRTLCVAGLLAFACGATAPALAQSTAPAQPAADAEQAEAVVAVVNGSKIYYGDVLRARQGLPAEYQSVPLEMIFELLLNQLVDQRLVALAAREAKIDEDPVVREQLRVLEDQVLQQGYLRRQIEPELTAEKLQARYDARYAAQTGPDEVRARHILLETEEKARQVLADIRGGADFAEAAKAHSTGPSGPRGGDLGFFQAGQMVPEFSEAAFALQPGEVSDPVQTQFGWHLIKVEERRVAQAPAFEEVADELRNEVQREVVAKVVSHLREGATIETFTPEGNPVIQPSGVQPPAGRQ